MFEFGEARVVHGDKGVGFGVMDGMGDLMAWNRRAWEICLVTRDER